MQITSPTKQAFKTYNLMSIKDFATAQGVDKRTIYNWIKQKRVKQVDFLGRKWIDKSTLRSK